eukprot:16002-Heterococcus_DN1.PRE.1
MESTPPLSDTIIARTPLPLLRTNSSTACTSLLHIAHAQSSSAYNTLWLMHVHWCTAQLIFAVVLCCQQFENISSNMLHITAMTSSYCA